MNKSKVENGEVMEEFDKLTDELFGLGEIHTWKERERRLKAFITNALNQQRVKLIKEIKKKIIENYGEWGDPVVESDLIPFLTKLEK